MSFPRYPEYKDSGVTWLGEVPAHWELKRLKNNLRLLTEKTSRRANPVALENIESWSGRFVRTESEFEGEGIAFDAGDILFGKLRPYLAKAFLADKPGEAVGDFHVLRPAKGIHPRFSQYELLNRSFIDIIDGSTFGSKMPRVSWEFMASISLPTPPTGEQVLIADFIDRETAKIEALVAEQEKLMALLKEKRQAVISHAVTKGLDPTVPMKDSGVEWLGEVPAHWEATRLSRICTQINDINHVMPVAVEEGVPFLSAKDLLDDGTLNFTNDIKQISEADFLDLSKKICPERGDIIYSRIGARLGKARLVENDVRFLVSYSCCVIRVVENVAFNRFIRHLLDGDMMLTEARMRTQGIGVPDLGLGEIGRFPVPLPPLHEQHAIAEFLDIEASAFDLLSLETQSAVGLLKERRAALISAAVTGKIDVRGLTGAKAA